MSLSAAVIDALLATGATREQIAAAMKADIAERDAADAATIEARRAGNRERQARFKAARRAESNADNALPPVTGVNNGYSPPFPAPAPSFPPDPQTNPTPTHTPEHTPRAREANPFPRPEWADPQHWKDFLANRKRRDMVNTATAHARFLGDIARLADDEWPPGKLLEHAAGKGWGSINKPDQENGNGRSHTLGRNQPAGEARILAAGRAFVSRGAGSAAQ